MRPLLVLAFGCLAIGGCATHRTPTAQATEVPAERRFAASAAGDIPVTFIRDTGFTGGGCRFDLSIDGSRVASIAQGEKATFRVTSGTHLVEARFAGGGLCRNDTDGRASRAAQINALDGSQPIYRIAVDDGGMVTISPSVE